MSFFGLPALPLLFAFGFPADFSSKAVSYRNVWLKISFVEELS
jgi:hypothetical protein